MIDIYLSNGEVAAVDASGALWRHQAVSTAAALEALGAQLLERPAKRVRVWLGAARCRPVRVAPVSGNLSRKERLRLMEMTAVAQSGLTPPCRVSIDAPYTAAAAAAVAVVVEETVPTAIERTVAAAGRRVTSIQPWWAHVLASALSVRPTLRALSVSDGGATTILVGQGQRFSSAGTFYPVDGVEAASAAFARTLISAVIPEDEALAVRLDWAAAGEPAEPAFSQVGVVFGSWAMRQGASF